MNPPGNPIGIPGFNGNQPNWPSGSAAAKLLCFGGAVRSADSKGRAFQSLAQAKGVMSGAFGKRW